MSTEFTLIEALERHLNDLVQAGKPSEVFHSLLEGSRFSASRAAIFLVRQGRVRGWGSVGYDAACAASQREFDSPADAGWLGELIRSDDTGPRVRPSAIAADPDFGQSPALETAGVVLRVKGRPIAVLVAELPASGDTWVPPVLGILTAMARLRLELDIVERKAQAASSAASTPQPQPVAAPQAPQATPTAETHPAPTATDVQELEAARRFARLVATDIRLYNEEAVVLGRQHGDLAQRLGEHLVRGKETFQRRHAGLGPTGLQILHDAFVNVLASGDGSLLPHNVVD